MAQFDANIALQVTIDKALRGIKKVEQRLQNLNKQATIDINVKNIDKVSTAVSKAETNTRKLNKALSSIESSVLSKLPQSVQTVVAYLKAASVAAKDLGLALAGVGLKTESLGTDFRGYVKEIQSAAAAMQRLAQEQSRLQRVSNLASGRSGSFLQQSLSNAETQRSQLIPGTGKYEAISRRILQLRGAINSQLRQQEDIEKRILRFQVDQAEAVRKNVRASQESRESSRFLEAEEERRDRAVKEKALRRRGLVEKEAIGPASQLGSLDADLDRLNFIKQQGEERAKQLAQEEQQRLSLLDRIQADELTGSKRIFDEKLRQINLLGDAQLNQIKAANQAELKAFDRKLRETEQFRQSYSSPAGPGNAAGEQAFRKQQSIFGDIDRSTTDAVSALNKINRLGKQLDADKSETARRLEDLEFQKKLDNIEKEAKAQLKADKLANREDEKAFDRKLRARETRRKRNARLGEDLALGAGFPLLFGGGPGSVAGGVAGAFAGGGKGGFGLQILLSALGGVIDEAVVGVAKLGQALNPLTADIDAVVAAAGESGTAFGQLVKDLEKVAGKEEALATATAQLATVIGTSGVNALRQFGAESTELGNEVAQALTIASSAVAEFINQTGILAILINNIDVSNLKKAAARNTTDPELQKLKEQRANVGPDTANTTFSIAGIKLASDLEDQIDALDAAIVARQRAIQLEEQLNIKAEASLALIEAKAAASNVEVNSLKAQIALEESGLDLTTEAGKALAEKVIEQQTYVALQAAINSGLSTEAILLNETLQKLQLKARAVSEREAADRKAEAAARKAASEQKRLAREAEQAANRAAQLEASLNNERAQQLQLGNQSIAMEFGEKIALQDKLVIQKNGLTVIEEIYNFKREQIKLTTEDIALEKEKLETLALQERIEIAKTKQQLEQINIAERLAALQSQQSVDSTRTGLNQELGGLALGLTPDLELANEQANRLQNTIKGLDNQLASLKEQRTAVLNPQLESAIKGIEGQKTAYQELLPQIFAAEQQQLKYNQALAAVTPGVNALVSGLQDVIAGTKTAEEAFADFLNTIADQLINTAATMIAQYIAIGIARMFAFGGNAGTSAGDFNLSGGGSSVGSGGLPGIDSLGGLFNGSLPFIGSGRAGGGPVNGGSPYMVGENGPELFIPGASGSITNNDQFEAARSAMGGSSGGSADAFAENTDALAVSNSYTRERVMERERSERSTSSGTMLIETQVINNVEYASVEQVEIAAAASAEKARAQVFSDMRNKPTTRRQLGLRA